MAKNQNFVNREELVTRAVETLKEQGIKISKGLADAVAVAFMNEIEGAVGNLEQVQLTGHLQIGSKEIGERTKRNPKTGEEFVKPAGRRLVVKGMKKLKDAVQKA